MAVNMKVAVSVLSFWGLVAGLPSSQVNTPPDWGDVYSVQGTLSLPYAEIEEQFSGYYDASNKRSRADFYNGMVKTYQRGDQGQYGTSQKVAPMTDYKVTNKMSCFQVNGVEEAPVTAQGMLPDLARFQKKPDQETIRGTLCDVWCLVDQEGLKKNTYTMWVSAAPSTDPSPVRYEMMGFDSLLGSHFDKYVLDYFGYTTSPIPEAMFDPPKNLTCGDFPGPGVSEHRILSNPLREYVNNDDLHVHEMFEGFKKTYDRKYSHEKEHAQRHHNFRQNLRFIHSKNRQGLSYTLAVNHLADKSSTELRMMNGYRHTPGDHGAKMFDKSSVDPATVPDYMDWRLLGAVTPVKDQGVCGSCWSFGTAETIEGAYFLKTGYRVRLSQQELIDCSWGEGNNGCDGGEDFRSYQWIMKNGGLSSEEQYGQYLAQDGLCHSDKVKPVAVLSGYYNVTPYDQQALTFAIATQGPISVAIDASHKSLSFYANGVYYEPQCGSKPDDLDHAVLAVGYGEIMNQKYWLIKNSWSTYWGNDGYVLMSQKNNNCGVATSPTYVTLQ